MSAALSSVKNPPGRCLSAFSMPFERGGVAIRLVGKNDVEQERRDARVGEVGGDARAHGAGSEHGNTTNSSHDP